MHASSFAIVCRGVSLLHASFQSLMGMPAAGCCSCWQAGLAPRTHVSNCSECCSHQVANTLPPPTGLGLCFHWLSPTSSSLGVSQPPLRIPDCGIIKNCIVCGAKPQLLSRAGQSRLPVGIMSAVDVCHTLIWSRQACGVCTEDASVGASLHTALQLVSHVV